jgi:four helix bundle suffix protein
MDVLRKQSNWENLYFYQKSQVLYQLTFVFVQRYLKRGDRTIDQMVQAARSGKQNIVEGSADGVTSMEMEIKLMNVARSSIKELKEDYEDYLVSRQLRLWQKNHPRYDKMVDFCKQHNKLEDYQPYFDKWDDETMANVALSLCHFVDRMMTNYEQRLEKTFVEEGGIKERMTAARVGYRTNQKDEISRLQQENEQLRAELERLKADRGSIN